MTAFVVVFIPPVQSRRNPAEEINRTLWNFNTGKLEQTNNLVISTGVSKSLTKTNMKSYYFSAFLLT